MLDILEREPQEAESSLKRHLEYDAVRSGQAIETARRDHRNAARKRQTHRTLPDAWTKLIESEGELLVELMSDKVENLCGVKPVPDAIAAFLRQQPATDSSLVFAPVPRKPRRTAKPAPTIDPLKSPGSELYGLRRRARSACDVLITGLQGVRHARSQLLSTLRRAPEARPRTNSAKGQHLRTLASTPATQPTRTKPPEERTAQTTGAIGRGSRAGSLKRLRFWRAGSSVG